MGFHRLWPLGQAQALGSVIVLHEIEIKCFVPYCLLGI